MSITSQQDLDGLREAGRIVRLTLVTTRPSHPVETGDGWAIKTADGALGAHHEHTLVITKGRPLLLTA